MLIFDGDGISPPIKLDPKIFQIIRYLYPEAVANYFVNGGPDPMEEVKRKLKEEGIDYESRE